MPRGGGGGGGHSSGGSHSFGGSRGGAHSMGRSSSGRSGSSFGGGSRSSFGGGSRSFGGPPPRGPRPPRNYGPRYYGPRNRTVIYHDGGGNPNPSSNGCLTSFLIGFVIFIVIVVMFAFISDNGGKSGHSGVKSTIERTKIETNNAFINDCVYDEIGWIKSENQLSKKLQYFWEETGVQPVIYLKEYDPALTSERAVTEWTTDYYDTYFADRQDVFLYVYCCDAADEGYGVSGYAVGTMAGKVMDSEAVDIFWGNLDYYWDNWDVNDNDGMFYHTFKDTADQIMAGANESARATQKTADAVKILLIVILVALIAYFIFKMVREKNRREKEKAEEDQKILNTPINDIAGDDLEKKYLNEDDK